MYELRRPTNEGLQHIQKMFLQEAYIYQDAFEKTVIRISSSHAEDPCIHIEGQFSVVAFNRKDNFLSIQNKTHKLTFNDNLLIIQADRFECRYKIVPQFVTHKIIKFFIRDDKITDANV